MFGGTHLLGNTYHCNNGHNGGVWKECECSQESCPLGQHKYFSENFEGEIALHRGGRKDYKAVLAKRCVVCVVLNGESGSQDDSVWSCGS